MTSYTTRDTSESNPDPRKLFQARKISFIKNMCIFLDFPLYFLCNPRFGWKSYNSCIQRKTKEKLGKHTYFKIKPKIKLCTKLDCALDYSGKSPRHRGVLFVLYLEGRQDYITSLMVPPSDFRLLDTVIYISTVWEPL